MIKHFRIDHRVNELLCDLKKGLMNERHSRYWSRLLIVEQVVCKDPGILL